MLCDSGEYCKSFCNQLDVYMWSHKLKKGTGATFKLPWRKVPLLAHFKRCHMQGTNMKLGSVC